MHSVHFATYPVTEPIHGGQIRVRNIEDVLRGAGGTCTHVAVFPPNFPGSEPLPLHFELNGAFLRDQQRGILRQDVHAARHFDVATDDYSQLLGALRRVKPDVFVLEQPWLWSLVERLRRLPDFAAVPVVYSSQNVETRLAEGLMSEDHVADVVAIEASLVAGSAGVIAVTSSDAAHFEQLGADRLVVAGNGTSPLSDVDVPDAWRRQYGDLKVGLFVGSAHPPNAAGFLEMLGPAVGYLPPDHRLVVLGGVCSLLEQMHELRRHWHTNLARIELRGIQPDEARAYLLELSTVIVLPITHGAGSNIKTAEALATRKPLLATSTAMRGFEEYRDLPNVHIADDPVAFRRLLVALLDANQGDPVAVSSSEQDRLRRLEWEQTLSDVPAFLEEVVRSSKPGRGPAALPAGIPP